ncbi:hypothetical protein CI610_00724 [invertebrate metagenome]|uniref:SAF domain-containing protein n=1 Tax=invertebrate metagenome TaxID=1711999 RepID=A0A2H9TAS6_9ZZZZ
MSRTRALFFPIMVLLAACCLGTLKLWAGEYVSQKVVPVAYSFLFEKAQRAADACQAERFFVSIRKPSQRMKIKSCKCGWVIQDLSRADYGWQLLKLRCPDEKNWSLLVGGHVSMYLPVLVSKNRILRGQAVSEEDVDWRFEDVSLLKGGYYTSLHDVARRNALKKIKAGQVLEPRFF